MKHLSLVFLFLFAGHWLSAQDKPSNDDFLPNVRHGEIGLNISNTLGSFFGTADNALTTDPYFVSLRIGHAKHRLRMGFNFKIKDRDAPDSNGSLKEKQTKVDVRIGYERVYGVSPRVALYWGIDGVLNANVERVEASSIFGGSSILKQETFGFGGGPVLGVMYRLHPRVTLSTESSLYAIYRTGTKEVNSPPDFSSDPINEFVWQPLLPTSLFINFSF